MKYYFTVYIIYLFYFFSAFPMNPLLIKLKMEEKINIYELDFDEVKSNKLYRGVVINKILSHYFADHLLEDHDHITGYLHEELFGVNSLKELMSAIICVKKIETILNIQPPKNKTKCRCLKNSS